VTQAFATKLVAELGRAFTDGQVLVLECRDGDKPVHLLCAMREVLGEGVVVMPVAELCSVGRLATLDVGAAVSKLGIGSAVDE
jgi:hypothetical protein